MSEGSNQEQRRITRNPNELTIQNSAVVLIDHQPWVAFSVGSIDKGELINNVTGLALAATQAAAGLVPMPTFR